MNIVKLMTGMLATVTLLAGCGGGGSAFSPSPTPTPITDSVVAIAVASSSAGIAPDGSTTATITATLYNASNNVVVGQPASFSASAGGGIQVINASSNAAGQVSATLTAVPGVAVGTAITVKVTSGTISGSVTVQVVKAGYVAGVKVTSSSAGIAPDGSTSATITGTLTDANNNVVGGQPATFAASVGGVIQVVNGTSDTSGHVSATLTAAAGTTSGSTVTVTVTSGTASGSTTVSVGTAGPVALIALTSNSVGIASDGSTTATLTATLYDVNNNVVSGQPAAFVATTGGGIQVLSPISNAAGQIKATLTAIPGVAVGTSIKVTVTSGTATANTTVKVGTTGAVASILVASSSPSIAPDGSTTAVITATLYDANSNVVSGQPATFIPTAGGGIQVLNAVSNAAGQVTATLSALPGVAVGTTITVNVSSGAIAGSTAVRVGIAGPVAAVTVATNSTIIAPDGSTSATITATLYDVNSNVVSGQKAVFVPTAGGGIQVINGTSNAAGQVTATLTAIPGVALGTVITVTVSSGSASGSRAVTVGTPGSVAAIAVSSSAPGVASDGSNSATITATLTDVNNNVVSGQVAKFVASSGGILQVVNGTSNASGQVTATVTAVPGTAVGSTITVTVSIGSVSNSTNLKVGSSGAVVSMTVASNSAGIAPDGSNSAVITATLYDVNNNVVSGQAVTFKASAGGGLQVLNGTSNSAGQVQAQLTVVPGVVTGTVITVNVTSGPVGGSTTVKVGAVGPVAAVVVSSNQAVIAPDGSNSAVITATLYDANNNAVSGQAATFTASTGGGLVVVNSTSNAVGQVVARLTAVNSPAVNTPITVTVVSGSSSAATIVSVGASGAVSYLIATTSTPLIAPDGSNSATITATLYDSNNNVVSGQPATFTAGPGGGLQVINGTSNAAGQVSATLTAIPGIATVGSNISVQVVSGFATGAANVSVGTTARNLSVITSQLQIPADGSQAATITALVVDSNNNVIPGVAVQFAATCDFTAPNGLCANLAVTNATTNANGVATATLGTANNPANRNITVTSSIAGAAPVTIKVGVSGVNLNLSGPLSIGLGATASYSLQLNINKTQVIAGQQITLSSLLGNPITPATVTTDSAGHAVFTLTANRAGNEVITATDASLNVVSSLGTVSQPISISSQLFGFTAPSPAPAAPALVKLGASYTATVNWTNNGVPVVGQTITFSTTRGTLSSNTAVTDSSGNASFTISSANAGPAILTASAVLPGTSQAISTQSQLNFVATTPAAITLQASPTALQTNGTSTVVAIVRDAAGNLVQGQTVQFVLTDITNGQLSVGSAVTNEQGVAETIYTASSTSSATNGVSITATVLNTSVTATTTLTVGGQTVFLSLGTGNTITPVAATPPAQNSTEYQQDWSVRAIDAQGNAVANARVTFSVTSTQYAKGYWCVPSVTCLPNTGTQWIQQVKAVCDSEDVTGSGILAPTDPLNIDFNGNGQLDPGLVAAVINGTGTTDANGLVSFSILYPKDHAEWVYVRLTASTVVAGSQSATTSTEWLPILSSDISNIQVSPPGVVSPYGVASSCANPN